MSSIRHALVSTMSIQMLATASTVTLSTIAPMVALSLGVESSLIGIYVCCIFSGAAISAVIGGTMVTRYGGIHVSQVCLILATIGLILTCLGNLWLMALGALFIGVSYGPITPASSDILAHTVPREKMGFVFSLKQTAVPLGSALAGFAIPGIALWAHDWRAGPLFTALSCLLVMLLVMYHRSDLDNHTDPEARFSMQSIINSLRLVITHPELRRLLVVGFTYNGAQMCIFSYIVAYLVEDVTLPIVFAGFALSTASAGGMIGRIFWGVFADWVRSPRLTLSFLGFLMASLAVTTSFFNDQWPSWLILVTVFGLGASAIGWNGVHLAQIARVAPAGKAGVATGGTLFFGFGGAIFLPVLFGKLHSWFGQYQEGFWVIATTSSLVALWLLMSRTQTKP